MIKLINQDNGKEYFLTPVELNKTIECCLFMMEKYNDMEGKFLSDDQDIKTTITKGKHELFEIVRSLTNLSNSVE